jgi:hypothetical protein
MNVQEHMRLLKSLSREHVLASAGSPDMITELLNNHQSNPLYVIKSNFATRQVLKQVKRT